MTRVRLDDNRGRRIVVEDAKRQGYENIAITADFTLVEGMAGVVALDATSTNRNVKGYTPTVTAVVQEYEIVNISSGTAVLTVTKKDGVTALGTLNPGERGVYKWLPSVADWKLYKSMASDGTQTAATQSVVSLYTTLAGLVNTNVIAAKVPFAFKLLSLGFRVRTPATTAAKAATLTAQVAGVAATGGVVSLTSANATPTNTLVAGTAITAGNVGTAGQTVEAAVSGVTAFAEGDGYVEFVVQNTSLLG